MCLLICRLLLLSPRQAIERANATEYGLASVVIGKDIDACLTVAHGMRAGVCWVNCYGEGGVGGLTLPQKRTCRVSVWGSQVLAVRGVAPVCLFTCIVVG